jgi:hypothetical protein
MGQSGGKRRSFTNLLLPGFARVWRFVLLHKSFLMTLKDIKRAGIQYEGRFGVLGSRPQALSVSIRSG